MLANEVCVLDEVAEGLGIKNPWETVASMEQLKSVVCNLGEDQVDNGTHTERLDEILFDDHERIRSSHVSDLHNPHYIKHMQRKGYSCARDWPASSPVWRSRNTPQCKRNWSYERHGGCPCDSVEFAARYIARTLESD